MTINFSVSASRSHGNSTVPEATVINAAGDVAIMYLVIGNDFIGVIRSSLCYL